MGWVKKHYQFLLIILLGFVVYGNSLFNGFVWDDREQIVQNVIIHNFSNVVKFFSGSTFYQGSQNLVGIYYRPIMTTVFSLIYSLFGSNPFPYHFISVCFYITNAIFLYLLFKKFFSKNISLFLSLIFLVHPINTEVVDYISSLGDILSFFFGISALLIFIEKKEIKLKRLLLITTLFTASLLSKETGALFLIAAFVYRILYFKEFKYWVIPTLTSTSIYLFLRIVIAKIHIIPQDFVPIMAASPLQKLMTGPKIITYYINNFFFPANLSISQQWVVRTLTFNEFYLPLFEVFITVFILSFLFLLAKKNNNKLLSVFIFSLIIFVLGIGAHIHFIPLFMTTADRWLYVPSIGLLGLIGILITILDKYTKTIPRFLILDLGIILISILAIRTFVRNFNWKDEITLYSHDVIVNPGSYELQNNIGNEYFRMGNLEEAKKHFEISAVLSPTNTVAEYNLGQVYFQQKNIPKAKFYFQKVVDINSDVAFAYENYARFLVTYDSPASARDFTLESLTKFPNDAKLWATLAVSYSRLNDKDKAFVAGKKAYELDPNPINTTIIERLQKGIKL